jgi:gamma-glutamyltranspeptidase/glutathione hydrolase
VDLIPGDGFIPACVPAMLDTFALILARFGTMTFSQIAAPSIELAEQGFALYDTLQNTLRHAAAKYPTTAEAFVPGGQVAEIGELIRNPDWAATVRLMCQAEAAYGKGRVAGIESARDAFYRGPIAEKILAFIQQPVQDAAGHNLAGLLTASDFADWHATLEEPVCYNYRGLDVYKCPPWTQGPVFLQQLALLEGYDLKALGHNSADYLHLVTEAAKLAFADREAYYGDPAFDAVPFDVLLSPEYNARQRALMDMSTADSGLRPGDVGHGIPEYALRSILEDNRLALHSNQQSAIENQQSHKGDTTHLDTADAAGNIVACTPSGGWIQSSPVIPGLGFPLGTRAQMFYLNPQRPNALQPHKRPRATLTPTIVTRVGQPYLGFGTQGGDMQDQWTLQFFLNVADFGMNLQEALDAPTIHSEHFPSSFYPREAYPQRLSVEGRIPQAVRDELARRGHEIVVPGDWAHGRVLAVSVDGARGTLSGGASPRQSIADAIGW